MSGFLMEHPRPPMFGTAASFVPVCGQVDGYREKAINEARFANRVAGALVMLRSLVD